MRQGKRACKSGGSTKNVEKTGLETSARSITTKPNGKTKKFRKCMLGKKIK